MCSNNTIIAGENDLATVFPTLASQWHPTKNEGLNSSTIAPLSNRKVWWQCDKGHEWQARVYSRTMGSGCPVCTNRRVLLGENDLATTHPKLKEEWHPTKNEKLRPEQFIAGTRQKVWWQCDKGHEWQASPGARAKNNSGCPYCTGRKVLAGFNDLATVYPKIAAQWHPTLNETLTPEMVTSSSNKKVWWECADGHVWKAVIYSRTGAQKTGCPVCAGRAKKPRNVRTEFK